MADVELLPLPEDYVDDEGLWEKCYGPYSLEQMEDYARANVARAVEPLQAEIEALRTEAEQHLRQAMSNGAKARAAQAQADNLRTEVEALRAEVERVTCELMDAITRADKLAEALQLAEEHIGALTPEWYSAGQRVLAEIRAALAQENGSGYWQEMPKNGGPDWTGYGG